MFKTWFDLGINRDIGIGNFFEDIISMIYTNILNPGDLAIDGGANRGRHTYPIASLVGQTGLVIAIEAIPSLANELSKSSNNIHVVNKALSNKIGITEFAYLKTGDGLSGIKERMHLNEFINGDVEILTMAMTTIDNEYIKLDTDKKVRFIKLDLEGGEYHALLGSEYVMKHHNPLIVFENGRQESADLYEYNTSSWFSLFEKNNYAVYDLFGRKFTPSDWDKYGIPWYFIACSTSNDIDFVEHKLGNLIGLLSNSYVRKSTQ